MVAIFYIESGIDWYVVAVGTGSRISQITVSDGAVTERLSVTYQTSGGPQTFNHGGNGGTPVTFDIGGSSFFQRTNQKGRKLLRFSHDILDNEVIVGVYGTYGPVSTNIWTFQVSLHHHIH